MTVRTLSAGALADLFAQHTDAVMLSLVTINHAEMPAPVRVVNNTRPLTYDGLDYIAMPFELTLPADVEDRIPSLEIRVDNVDRTLVELLRSVDSPPSVRIEVVRVKDDRITSERITSEIGPLDFTMLDHSITVGTVTLQVGYAIDILNEPAVRDIFNPGTSPGLF